MNLKTFCRLIPTEFKNFAGRFRIKFKNFARRSLINLKMFNYFNDKVKLIRSMINLETLQLGTDKFRNFAVRSLIN